MDVHSLQAEDRARDVKDDLINKEYSRAQGQWINLWDVIDGWLHAAELRRLDVEHLQHIVGECVDQVGDAGQRLSSVVLGLLQRPLLVWRLNDKSKQHESKF